jgi:hypothetical protein
LPSLAVGDCLGGALFLGEGPAFLDVGVFLEAEASPAAGRWAVDLREDVFFLAGAFFSAGAFFLAGVFFPWAEPLLPGALEADWLPWDLRRRVAMGAHYINLPIRGNRWAPGTRCQQATHTAME